MKTNQQHLTRVISLGFGVIGLVFLALNTVAAS